MAQKTGSKDPRFDNAYMALVDDLRGAVHRFMLRENVLAKPMAEQAGVHPKTLAKFLSGETMAPQLPTIFRLTRACGIELMMKEGGRPRILGRRRRAKLK